MAWDYLHRKLAIRDFAIFDATTASVSKATVAAEAQTAASWHLAWKDKCTDRSYGGRDCFGLGRLGAVHSDLDCLEVAKVVSKVLDRACVVVQLQEIAFLVAN